MIKTVGLALGTALLAAMVPGGAGQSSGRGPEADEVLSGGVELARDVGLWLHREGPRVDVDRLSGWAAYPRQRGSARLFTLLPAEVGRYRANFRFTGCACDPSWYYEDWVVHVSNGPVEPDRFIPGRLDHDIDERVHLYGGATRSAGRRRTAG